jgi:hypothetical protein
MPEEIDPYQQALEDLARQRKQYDEIASAPPQYERPGFWRSLAAIGAGAFGGSQYDKGGMQWGQQIGQQIIEGPYQRRMNEHLKMLAAKRQGLDSAYEGVGTLGQIEARKQQIEVAKQNAADRKANNEEKLKADKLKNAQVYDAILSKQTGNEAVRYPSMEAIQADPDAQAKIKAGTHTLRQPAGTDLVYLAPTAEYRRQAAFEDVLPIATQINKMISANPILQQRGFQPVDAQKASAKGAAALQNVYKEMNDVLNLEMQAKSRASRGGGGDDDAKAYAADQKRKNLETAQVNTQFAALKSSKENQYLDQIARARAAGNEEQAKALEKQRGVELVEALNNAHLRIANIWGHEKFKQARLKDGKVEEFWVGKGAEQVPTQQPAQLAASKVLTKEIAKQFLQDAGMDQAKAEAMARAQGYNWK